MSSKIKDVRAKLYTWKGPIQKIHDNFCTSAADLLNKENISADGMSTFKFLSWLVVEVETEDGHIGLVMLLCLQNPVNLSLIII